MITWPFGQTSFDYEKQILLKIELTDTTTASES